MPEVISQNLNSEWTNKFTIPLFKAMDIGNLLTAHRHEDAVKIAKQTREWNAPGREILHVREVKGREGSERPHSVYGGADAAVAGIFAALVSDARIQSTELLQEASSALYGWRAPKFRDRPSHPIVAALEGIECGEHWAFRLDVMVSDQTGDRQMRAYLYNFETGYPRDDFPAEYTTRVSVMVQLAYICAPIIAAVNGKAGH